MTIDWPPDWERTPARERTRKSSFKSSLGDTTEALATELSRMRVDDWRVSTGSGGAHTKQNGLPKASANPDDPGFVLRWTKSGEQYAVACDAYSRLRDNARAVYLWLHETRMRAQRPIRTGDTEFAAARLPAGDEEPTVATPPPEEVLGVRGDAPESAIKGAARERLKEAHPDNGGSVEEVRRVKAARDQLLEGGDDQ